MTIKTGLILALAAGSVATAANDNNNGLNEIALDNYQIRDAGYDGFVYHLGLSGERIVTTTVNAGRPMATRGSAWAWDNSVIDFCVPASYDPDDGLSIAVFTGLHDQAAGVAQDPGAILYWNDWLEAPADTIINGMTFGTFAQVVDVDADGDGVGDGVDGLDWFMVFTENDHPGTRSEATAHSPILIEGIPGSLDVGSDAVDDMGNLVDFPNDGVIGFQEAQLIIQFIDFNAGDTPTDIEIADTNGVSDGAFGADSIYSGVPGVDTQAIPDFIAPGTQDAGLGLFNVGFVVGYRQPNVGEGDGLITRYPELAGLGLENPDGLDVPSLANIQPMGFGLVGPSAREDANPRAADPAENGFWPADAATPQGNEGVGAWDNMALVNAIGEDIGFFFFGGAVCDPAAQAAGTTPPFYTNPWSGYDISFNINRLDDGGGNPGCNLADNAEPFGVLDLADIGGFVTAFQGGCGAAADIAEPFGVCDLADIGAFVTEFQAGCP